MDPKRPRIRKLSDRQFLHLLRMAAGLLLHTDGDLERALAMAIRLHQDLLDGIKENGLRSDLGPGDAVLYVPDTGGLAIRLERHPVFVDPSTEEAAPTEEAEYPEIDLLGFEVIEPSMDGDHVTNPNFDTVVDEETWID